MRRSILSIAAAVIIAVCGLSLTACQSTSTANNGVSAANPSTMPSQTSDANGYRHNIGNGAYGEDVP
jgi:hypothetical protein